ncbi:membrane protein [Streptomyces phage Patelgo]|nr:membrane protein [Streptomyces phage Patelgo]
MTKRYKDPVEETFNEIMGGCAIFFALLFFLPFVGIGIGIGYWIWG